MAKGKGKRDKAVKRQYEALPYPPRDPKDEAARLIEGSPSHLDELNHYLFAGKRNFSAPFRALIAGGGTGDAAIMLAQHLTDRGEAGRVTYLDLSTASRKVAEARAEARGLKNVDFITGSLLDLPSMQRAPFDYIDCCGVLHHLEEPEVGLAALAACLADDGGMGLMVYATLGRTGVYPVQNALRTLTEGESVGSQVNLAKSLLNDLPPGNWLNKNKVLGDHKMGEDAALYDLLLHPRDRSYLVPEVLGLLGGAGLELVSFIEPIRYDPEIYLKDMELRKRARKLGDGVRAALAENLSGTIKTHTFYVRKQSGGAAGAAKFDPEMIPILKDNNAEALSRTFAARSTLTVHFDKDPVTLDIPEGAAEFVRCIDSRKSLRDIQSEMSMTWANFRARYAPVYKMLQGLNLLWLKSS
ncbi:bifunctional 2-polyprenyl-6-hydroxyphenol methylase/3-demethylubiquinol 3-O-methyltransferase UbiG [Sneathiella sp.]|uniref:class I SAM-dependent methyltransferase n=1 Tax=Sneathiella sp. TaxID=1964365 RepID=UPI002625A08C|nr:class I SAM-dependent methyltransferase [Sneathiella sp.]MDF2367393.1 class I SAM-dependent methyltransferase [Sneathiella sp.]